MKKILVPIDFSTQTEVICMYAIELAKKTDSEVCLFHTYYDQFFIADSSSPESLDISTFYNEELLKEVSNEAQKDLDQVYEHLHNRLLRNKITNVTLTRILTAGDIVTEFKAVCAQYQPDMVIMGSKGRGKNENVWGNFSTYFINHSRVPVMTIPPIKKYLGFTNIMFSADLSEGNPEALNNIVEIFAPFKYKLHCVHFMVKIDKKEEIEEMEFMKRQFAGSIRYKRIAFHLIQPGRDTQKSIDDFIRENNIDLIAFQPHKYNIFYRKFMKLVTKKNLYSTNIPLLAVPGRK
ncbi:MAG: universal stress protein [Bacteroidetes bacterium]|nr:universal stress protein [Bacteroidota bacterium]